MIDLMVNILCSCCCSSSSVGAARGVSCCEAAGTCFIYYKLYQCCSYISTQVSKCCTWTSTKIKECNSLICPDSTPDNSIIANNNIPVAIMVDSINTNPFANNPGVNLMGSLPTNSEQPHSDDW